MAEMVWYFDGASEGWFRFRCWLVLVFFQQGGGGKGVVVDSDGLRTRRC